MKVSELTGVQLDYWTARTGGRTAKIMRPGERLNGIVLVEPTCVELTEGYSDWWQPFHVYWGSAGPIIERKRISLDWCGIEKCWIAGLVHAELPNGVNRTAFRAETPIVAAMRAFVASKFGEEVPT